MEITIKKEQVEDFSFEYSNNNYSNCDETIKEEPCWNNLSYVGSIKLEEDATMESFDDSLRNNVKLEINENSLEIKEVYCCFNCDFKFISKPTLIDHIQKTHTNTSTTRPFCTSEAELEYGSNSSESNQTHKCFKCELTNNIREEPHECSICKYKSDRKVNLRNRDKQFTCTLCESRFSRKSTLKTHMLIHSDTKPYRCHICEYKCCRRGNLQNHMVVHTGEKPFQCHFCKFRCSLKSNLQKHVLTHREDNPYQCSICKYKCKRKEYLKDHMLVHTGEKPYQCLECKYKCNKKRDLQKHTVTHTGEKPFQCPFCDRKCALKYNLQRHLLTHTDGKTCKVK